jgi:hypothetical protein
LPQWVLSRHQSWLEIIVVGTIITGIMTIALIEITTGIGIMEPELLLLLVL